MNLQVLTIAALAAYALVMWTLARRSARQGADSTLSYHAANRSVGWVVGSLSLASTWIWAPALFVSSTQAYNNGWVGVLWFVVPNALALLLMIPFAMRIRAKYPTGFTLSGFMRRRYGPGVQKLYLLELGGLSTLSISVNLLAGGAVLSMLTGLPFLICSVLLLAVSLLYTYRYGVRASFHTDVAQILFIIGMLLIFVPGTLSVTGMDVLRAGLDGVNNITGFFDASGAHVAATFGIISAIGLAAGPVGDQSFWQRAFSLKRADIAKSFTLSALAFAVVPVLMTTFGFIAAGQGTDVARPDYVNLHIVESIFPQWMVMLFLFMVVSALLSTVNSQMLALASLTSDLNPNLNLQRGVMVGAAVIALLVANVPGNTVASMFLIYSTLRSAMLLITTTTLLGARWNARAVAWGIGSALAIGFPLAVYGNVITGGWVERLTAICVTTALPLIVAYVGTLIGGRSEITEPNYRTPAERRVLEEAV